MKQETIPDDEKKTSTKRTPKKNATPISTKRKKMADNDKPDAPPPTATPSSSIVDADGDVAMVDVDSSQPIPTSDVAPTTQPSPSTTVEDDEEEQKDHDSENDSEFDDDDDENGINSDLYQPQLNSTPELCDPSDRFGSFDQRSDYMLHRLSPLYIPTTMPGYESPSKDLTDLLTRTMTSSINNAALILGPHGSGCTSLLEMCLRKLRKEFIMKGKSFVEVRLNGNVQTDDTLAMRSVATWSSTHRHAHVRIYGHPSLTFVLASLSLSPPPLPIPIPSVFREIVFQVCRDHELEHLKDSADFHAHLNFLIEILNQGTFHETPILFILDEFHLFTQRTKQTLLYNLCDLLQSQKAQLCLVGLSSHYNCYERLEKRIRSRMSHRRIILGPPIEMVRHGGGGGGGDGVDDGEMIEKSYNLQKSETLKMEHIIQILKDRLIIPIDEKVNGTGASASASSSTALTPSHPPSPAILAHNASITRLLSRTDSPRLHALLAFFQLHRMQIGTFFKIFTFGIQSSLNMYHPNLLEEDIVHAFQYWRKDWIKEGLKRKEKKKNKSARTHTYTRNTSIPLSMCVCMSDLTVCVYAASRPTRPVQIVPFSN